MEPQQHSAVDAPQPLVDGAAESMLGPNPFIGFRPQDIAAAFGELAGQALRRPIWPR